MSAPDAIDEDVECPIRLSRYDLLHRIPLLLHPPHTFCSACLDVLVDVGQQRRANSCAASRFVVISCPLCRVEVRCAVSEARVNSVLRDQLQARAVEVAAAALVELDVEGRAKRSEARTTKGRRWPRLLNPQPPPHLPLRLSRRRIAQSGRRRRRGRGRGWRGRWRSKGRPDAAHHARGRGRHTLQPRAVPALQCAAHEDSDALYVAIDGSAIPGSTGSWQPWLTSTRCPE